MVLKTEKSAALMTILIMIFILMVLSTALLKLVSNQTRLVEHDISRIKSKYASEAAMVRNLEQYRRGVNPPDATHGVSGRFDDPLQNWNVGINSSYNAGIGVTVTDFEVDYSPL